MGKWLMTATQWTENTTTSCDTSGFALRLKVILLILWRLFSRSDHRFVCVASQLGEPLLFLRSTPGFTSPRRHGRLHQAFHLRARALAAQVVPKRTRALLDLWVLCMVLHAPFISVPPTSRAPRRPSLAAPALSLITRCRASNKSLTVGDWRGVEQRTALFIRGLHGRRVPAEWLILPRSGPPFMLTRVAMATQQADEGREMPSSWWWTRLSFRSLSFSLTPCQLTLLNPHPKRSRYGRCPDNDDLTLQRNVRPARGSGQST